MTDAPKTIAEMPALKPCPFCGRRPIFGLTKKTGCQLHGEPVQHVTLRCGGTGCPARAGVVGGDVYNVGKDKARDEAVAAWNRRTLPADDAEAKPGERIDYTAEQLQAMGEAYAAAYADALAKQDADDAEMEEKVARALFAAEFYERRGGPVFVSPTDERWKAWLPLARAALSAMRGDP